MEHEHRFTVAEHKRKKHGTTEAGKKNAYQIFKQIAKNEVRAMWACVTPGSRRQKGNSPLTCSSPQPFTGLSQGTLGLYPGGFLSDPDRHSLHDSHTLPYVSGGPWSGGNSMSLPHGRILLKIWGQIISWPFHSLGNRIFSLSKTEAGPGQHKILTGPHHYASKHEHRATGDYCWGGARGLGKIPPRCKCPAKPQSCRWSGNIIKIKIKLMETQLLP